MLSSYWTSPARRKVLIEGTWFTALWRRNSSEDPPTHLHPSVSQSTHKYWQLTQSRAAARVNGETYRNLKKQIPDWQHCYKITKRNKIWGVGRGTSFFLGNPTMKHGLHQYNPLGFPPHLVHNIPVFPAYLLLRRWCWWTGERCQTLNTHAYGHTQACTPP